VGPAQEQRRGPVLILNGARRRAATLRSIIRNAHSDPVVEGRPLVSVVIPTYNWSNVLRHAIRSVLWQSYSNLELLVIGDGCTDDSEEVVASFGDERVRWHNLKSNTGSQATPNNKGLDLARGDYIAYQGHDDIWHPNHLGAALSSLQWGRADLSYSLAEVLGPPGSRCRFVVGRVRPQDLAPGTWLTPASIVHRVDLGRRIGGWRTWEDGQGPPDVDFLDRARESGASMVRVPALTAFKFPSIARPNVYRERPSHEQEAYIRRIERERLFVERELIALAWRRASPLKMRLPEVEEPTGAEMLDPKARFAYLRRVRGLS
jgi:glycosyltransferase involved in cell wall biosynthesis